MPQESKKQHAGCAPTHTYSSSLPIVCPPGLTRAQPFLSSHRCVALHISSTQPAAVRATLAALRASALSDLLAVSIACHTSGECTERISSFVASRPRIRAQTCIIPFYTNSIHICRGQELPGAHAI